jgi:hypothetical protein
MSDYHLPPAPRCSRYATPILHTGGIGFEYNLKDNFCKNYIKFKKYPGGPKSWVTTKLDKK